MIESEALAKRVLDTMERDFGPENSWHVTLAKPGESSGEEFLWSGLRNGEMIQLTSEPDASLWRKFNVWFFKIVPEDLL
jgi:hypothetical protein